MADTDNLTSALAKVQGNLPSVHKDAKGNFGKYVTLDAIHEAIMPLLSANGLAWVTMPTYDDNGEPILEYKLMHTSGEKLEGKMRMYVSQPNSQQQGSAITYAKRYAICAVVGVTADADDDGQAATTAPAKPYQKKAYVAPAPPQEAVRDIHDDLMAITDDQLKSIIGLLDRKGITEKEDKGTILKRFAKSSYKKESIKDISSADYTDLITTISAMDGDALKNLVKGE